MTGRDEATLSNGRGPTYASSIDRPILACMVSTASMRERPATGGPLPR
jgi:hypothetical protein